MCFVMCGERPEGDDGGDGDNKQVERVDKLQPKMVSYDQLENMEASKGLVFEPFSSWLSFVSSTLF